MIIEGCILILLSVLTLILALAVRNFGVVNDTEIVDGVIATSDSQKKEVIVNYKINNKMYSSAYDCETYANVGEIPPVGLKVRVSVDPNQPDKVVFMHLMREMGRGLSGRHDYIDNSNKKSRFSISFLIVMLFLAGVYLILHGLSII
ncbi:MAG: hypothetical protein IJN43_15855 [Ruminococcus sp.]|nr:hypothetical protein [Ruminococcus sp.]